MGTVTGHCQGEPKPSTSEKSKPPLDWAKVKPFDPFAGFESSKGAVKHSEYAQDQEQHPLQRSTRSPSPFGQSLWKNPLTS